MKRTLRERLFAFGAPAVSIVIHLLLIAFVMDLTLGRAGSTLFARQQQTPEPMRITRSTEDLLLTTPTLNGDSPSNTPADSALDPSATPPDKLEPPTPPADLQLTQPADAPAPPDTPTNASDPAPATPGSAIDLAADLLALAEPTITLPTFRAADDNPATARTTTTSDINTTALTSVDAVSLRRLKDLLGSTSGTPAGSNGSDNGSANSNGTGSGNNALPSTSNTPPPPPLSPPTSTAPPTITPPILTNDIFANLPDLSEALAPQPPQTIQVAEHLDDDFTYTLYTLPQRPQKQGLFEALGFGDKPDPNAPGYLEVRITPRRSLSRLQPLYKDVVWVIDTSGSIDAVWSNNVQQGVAAALDTLNEGDRFNIVTFQDTVSVLSPEAPLEAAPHNIDAAKQFLLRSERGGWTDVNQALGRLVVRNVPDNRVYQIILITDGRPTRGALDPRGIINMITRENALVGSIHAVAVGNTIDRELLEYLTYRNKGYVLYPNNPAGAAADIRDLAGRLRYPIMKNATFSAIGVNAELIYPQIPRDIYQGDTLSLFGRYDKQTDRALSMQLTGTSGNHLLDFTFSLPIPTAKPGQPDIATQWALWKLHHLYSQLIQQGESRQLRSEIDELQKEYDLKKRR